MTSRRTLAAATFAGAATLLFVALIVAHPLEAELTQLVINLSLVVVPLLAAAGCAWAARNARDATRRAWMLLALAMIAWAAGQAFWSYAEEVLGDDVPFPSWADLGYLAFIPLALWGMSSFSATESSRNVRIRTILDGLLVACSLFSVSWVILLSMLVEAQGGWTAAIGLAYPTGDVLLATWVITLGSRVRPGARARWWLLGGGVLAFAFSDSLFAYQTALDLYATGGVTDVGWFVGFLLIGLAGVLSSSRREQAPLIEARPTTAAISLPYIPFGIALVFVAIQGIRGIDIDRVQFWTFLTLGALVILRQMISLLENAALTRRLERANADLSESERARARLLNTITHDLLNPITPMRLQLDILDHAKPPLAPRQTRSLVVLRRNLDLLERLVKDVKDLARLETGKLPLTLERIDVAPIVEHAIQTYAPVADARGVHLHAEPAGALTVVADRERLTQVLFNLVSNALKFTPPGGEIVVGVSVDEKGGRVYVRDTGRGLTEDEIHRLFKPFSQVHERGETSEKGTGLGLFLSRAIAEQHGGALWVESPGRARGSTFHLRLPRVA